jgi:crotonobetaine/carnitine-CoA ligase
MTLDLDLHVDDRSFLGSLTRAAALRGDQCAVRFTDGGDYTAKDLLLQTGRLASVFDSMGVQKGDRVAILCDNRVEFLWAFFAAAWLGAVPAPLNISLRGGTLRHPITELEPKVIVCDNVTAIALADCLNTDDPRVMNVDSHSDFSSLRAGGTSMPFVSPRPSGPTELAMISYTSGTTGPSKGIMYSNDMTIAFAESNDWLFGYTANDVAFNCLPLFHGNSVFCTLIPALRAGALAVFAPRFSASAFWKTVRAQGATVLSLLGSMVPILLNQQPAETDSTTTARIALAVPMPDDRFQEFQERFGIKLTSLYGLTDLGVVIGVPHDIPGRPGKCGIENPIWECVVADDDGNPVPDGVIGELLVRPRRPNVMQMGYWRNAEATLVAWRDLWFHTGDYLRRDSDGWYAFIDRKKDAMRRFGENISSFEVESALMSHPSVVEVAVYPVPAELAEDEVMASIVLDPELSVDPAQLLKHCESQLPYYAVPRYYRIVAELPKTATAKVQKSALREIGIDELTWDAGPRGRSKRG